MSVSSLAEVYAPMACTIFAFSKSNEHTRTHLNQLTYSRLHHTGHCDPLQPTEAVHLGLKCRRNDACTNPDDFFVRSRRPPLDET